MGILLVFDVTDERSFNNIRNWIKNTEQYATEGVNKILIGNKCDIHEKRVVTFDQAQSLANEYNLPYVETSAKSGLRVDDAFLNLARDIKKRLIDSIGFDEKKKGSLRLANDGSVIGGGISGTVERIKNSCCSGAGTVEGTGTTISGTGTTTKKENSNGNNIKKTSGNNNKSSLLNQNANLTGSTGGNVAFGSKASQGGLGTGRNIPSTNS